MAKTGIIFAINGPIVKTSNDSGFEMHEMVYVGKENLVGEVIGLTTQLSLRFMRRPAVLSPAKL